MRYVDYSYYTSIYGNSMPESDFNRLSWKAEKYIDKFTLNKLQFAFPKEESAIKDVQMCMIEIISQLYQVEQYQKMAIEGMGYTKKSDGTLIGKVVTSVASGSESRGYSSGGNSISTEIGELAKNSKKLESSIYGIVRNCLDWTKDSNGVPLTNRALPYPVRNAPISRPPENKPVSPEDNLGQQPETPPEDTENGESIQTQNDSVNVTEDDGLGYIDSIIVYNQYTYGIMQKQTYFGTRFDNVRIELTQGANQKASGMENASVCVVKIPNANLPKPYKSPPVWLKLTTEEMLESFTLNKGQDFFLIVKKDDLGIDVDLPDGMIESNNYEGYDGGFFEYVKTKYGYAYTIDTVDVYTLIPRFEIGGK